MTTVGQLIKKRGGFRAVLTKTTNEIRPLLDLADNVRDICDLEHSDYLAIKTSLDLLKNTREKIELLNNDIYDSIENVDELTKDMLECASLWQDLEINLIRARSIVSEYNRLHDSRNLVRDGESRIRLPKITLPVFSGKPLEWQGFFDIYTNAIHNQLSISKAEKFSYLKGVLSGPALDLVAGFSVGDQFYDEAVKLLIDTYGDTRVIIQAHLDGIFDLHEPSYSAKDLNKFRSEFEVHLRGLQALNAKVDEAGFIIVALLIRKLPVKVVDNINRSNRSPFWTLNDFRQAISEEIKLLVSIESKKQTPKLIERPDNLKQSGENKYSFSKNIGTCNFNVGAIKDKEMERHTELCRFCFFNHTSGSCFKYKTGKNKVDRAKALNLCFLCLNNGHRIYECKAKFVCRNCSGKHNTMLCLRSDRIPKGEARELTPVSSASSVTDRSNVALPIGIMPVLVGNEIAKVRTLFDQGSQRTFLTVAMAKHLNIKPTKRIYLSINSFTERCKPKTYDVAIVAVVINNEIVTLETILVDHLPDTLYMPGIGRVCERFKELNIALADPGLHADQVSNIAMIVGADYYCDFITAMDSIEGINVLESKLGKMVIGRLPGSINCDNNYGNLACLVIGEKNDIQSQVEKIWILDSIGISEDNITIDDNKAIELFKGNIKYVNGRYEVALPWKEDKIYLLARGYNIAKTRLFNMHKQLYKNNLLQDYDAIIKDQLKRGFIEKVNSLYSAVPIHYLPHHAVKKESATTPIRIVYDCSAGKPSLNDCLYTGPSLINDLVAVLLRFRLNNYVAIGDIEKAYHMIALKASDRDATRFLWWSDPSDCNSKLDTYRFKVVLFGATCSQFILLATIGRHIGKFSDTSEEILRNIYVDNVQITSNCEKELRDSYYKIKSIFDQAGFKLQGWATNSSYVNDHLAKSNHGYSTEVVKVLGMNWNYTYDVLSYNINLTHTMEITKRNIVSIVGQIFDPLGFLSPVTIKCKIFIQDLWKNKHDWDDILESDLIIKWNKLLSELLALKNVSVPRVVTAHERVHLHAFCDASKLAYGAVIYLVSGNDCPRYLISRARVAPLKSLTIPQLEITSCLIAARLIDYVAVIYKQELQFETITLWSDSQVAIAWIKSKNKLKTYVQNRVDEIRKLIPTAYVNYIESKSNPADLITRGVSDVVLKRSELWRKGPDEIYCDITARNDSIVGYGNSNVVNNLISTSNKSDSEFIIDLERYSSLYKVNKIFALVLRFLSNLKAKIQGNPLLKGHVCDHKLLREEIKNAQLQLIILIQKNYFSDEYKSLTSIKVESKSNLVKQLNLFLEHNIIRCKGRLRFADMSSDSKYPILLPSTNKYTDLVIRDCHEKKGHFGISYVLCDLRQKWWVPRMRQNVKRVLSRCIICKKLQGKPVLSPPVPPLPRGRIAQSIPFSVIGIDYTGALSIKHMNSINKVYIVLFTCAVTRAIHLEITLNLTCESFIMALRRFISRRNLPSVIYSDNASYFQAAAKYLRKQSFTDFANVNWKFIPARAPWYGGFWERLISITKSSLKKIIGRSVINYDELFTIITEVEMFINNRPLTYISDNLDDVNGLTPNELLTGYRRSERVLENQEDDIAVMDREVVSLRYLRLKKILSRFWERWSIEYLSSIRERHSWLRNKYGELAELRCGDVVLVHNEGPRLYWRLALVKELHLGADGIARSATVQTSGGEKVRAIKHLYPLELHLEGYNGEQTSNAAEGNNDKRPKRVAAVEAAKRFASQLN